MNKDHLIVAQNAATAAAAVYVKLYPEPPFVLEIFEDIRRGIADGSVEYAVEKAVTETFPGSAAVQSVPQFAQAQAAPAYAPAPPSLPSAPEYPPPPPGPAAGAPPQGAVPSCPQCGGEMWDNRADKRNPRSPDFKCKDKGCGKGVWATPYQR